MVVTATEVTVFSNISASAVTVAASGLIPIVQDRINLLTNNYFTTELQFEELVTFNATARTITCSTEHFERWNFLAGDDMMVYRSYRNDGYYTLLSVNQKVATLATGSTVVDELSGQSILLSVVKWPNPVKYAAAQMVAYDYDVRPSVSAGIRSRSLGPWSESYGGDEGEFGYPKAILEALVPYRIARLN
jgi:hypothetical protein